MVILTKRLRFIVVADIGRSVRFHLVGNLLRVLRSSFGHLENNEVFLIVETRLVGRWSRGLVDGLFRRLRER